MAINLSNVNISLRQFQEISSGTHNAGEVKLTSETGIDKVNNHVTMKFLNTTKISHEEVLAIKNAFVKALKSGGVNRDEINRIREELGLAPMKPVDRNLHERSIKPLSRQQIREILDRNAAAINDHVGPGTIRTSQEMNANVSERTLDSRTAEREAANAELGARREVVENKSIFKLQAVLAGDVDFATAAERDELLSTARRCLDAVLVDCKAKPRDDVRPAIHWTAPGGKDIAFSAGLTEKALVRKLEDIIVRLAMDKAPSREELAIRDEFKALATPDARKAWADNLANDPNGAFKARTIAVMIMHDRGIDDAATLSVVNRLKNDAAIAFAKGLVDNCMNLEGDALRESVPVERALADVDPDADISEIKSAYIPALTDQEFNEQIASNMLYHPEKLPATFRMLVEDATFEVRARFGAVGYPDDAKPTCLTRGSNMTNMVGVNDPNAPRITTESLRDRYIQEALAAGADRVFNEGVEARLKAAGLNVKNSAYVANALKAREPACLQRILAAPSPEAADAVLNDYMDIITESARLLTATRRCHKSIESWARETLAKKLGVSVQSLPDSSGLNLNNLVKKGALLISDICDRKNKAATDAEIEAEFRKLADKFIGERMRLFDKIDASDITAEAKSAIKATALALAKVNYLDIDKMLAFAKAISPDKLANLLASNAPKEQVFAAMREIDDAVKAAMNKAFEADINAGKEVGAEEEFSFTAVFMAMIVLSKPGMEGNLVKFLSENVVGRNYTDEKDISFPAKQFMMAFEPNPGANAELASKLGKDEFPVFHTKALMEAVREEGLGEADAVNCVPPEFKPGQPAYKLLKTFIETAERPISAPALVVMARAALRSCKAAILAVRQNKMAVENAERQFLAGNGATRARAAGYHQSELPKLAKAFALYKVATNATDEDALAAVLDPANKAARLMNYGGRFMESAESFRSGLALMDKFAQWYANLSADVHGENFDTPTKVNANKGALPADGVKGYEMFVFQDLAIRPDVNLDEQDLEKLFGIGHNDAVNFFARGNGSSCVGTLAKLSPAKRQVVYAAFKAIEPPLEANPNRASTNVRNNVGYLARILRHFDEVVALQAEGKLDRAHLNAILTPDLDLPPDATSKQVWTAIEDRAYARYADSQKMLADVITIINNSGTTITETLEAVETGKKPAFLPDIASTSMTIDKIDGTTNGGRKIMLGDLHRPDIPNYSAGKQPVLTADDNFFVVNIGGESIQCVRGSANEQENAHIADKIETLCGKVHVEQANTVMRGLAQGAHTPILATLPQYGLNVSEHMALTYSLSKNDETGAVTIRYSEPKGFPLKFSWETTVALDGTSTTTPIVVDEPKDFPGYMKLAGVEGGGLFTSNTVAPGKGPAATAFRNIVDTRGGAPANASPVEKAKAFANKVNERGAKEMTCKLALVASKNLVAKNGDVKKMDVDSVNFQFNRDLRGGYKFFYPGVEGASQDYNTNRDNLVRFVTDDNNATFATATEATKRKVGILMAMLTQYTSTLVTDTVTGALALPNSTNGFFTGGVFGVEQSGTEFHLAKDADGNIKITTKDRQSVSMLQTFAENDETLSMNPVKQGSYYEYEMEITLPKDNLETLSSADWAQYDREAVNDFIGDIDGRNALIPEEFRFNGTVDISYHMHLNEN